jgi:hypothetical protein
MYYYIVIKQASFHLGKKGWKVGGSNGPWQVGNEASFLTQCVNKAVFSL